MHNLNHPPAFRLDPLLDFHFSREESIPKKQKRKFSYLVQHSRWNRKNEIFSRMKILEKFWNGKKTGNQSPITGLRFSAP